MTTPPGYMLIDSEPALHKCLADVAAAPAFGLDLETTGLDPRHDSIVGISMSVEPNQGWYIPVGHTNTNFPQTPLDVVIEALKLILETVPGRGQTVAIHNAKFDTAFLQQAGVNTPDANIHDTLLEAFSDGETHYRLGLKYLAQKLFHIPLPSFEDVVSTVAEKNMAAVPVNLASDYACADADFCLRIHQNKFPSVKNNLTYHMENQLWPALRGAESRGMAFNRPWHDNLMEQVQRTATFIRNSAEFNPHPNNLKANQDINALVQSLDTNNLSNYVEDDDRIHPRYWQVGEFAGQCTTMNPCMEKMGQYRSWHILEQDGSQTHVTYNPQGSFMASPGYYLLTAEYRQPEMIIFGIESNNKDMVDGYTKGGDIHLDSAARFLGKPPAQVTRQERDQTKVRNYKSLYANPSMDDAPDDLITAYRNALHQQCMSDGCVTTGFDRRIPLGSRDHQPGYVTKLFVKGSASDSKKLALLRMSQIMPSKHPEEDVRLAGFINGKQVWEVRETLQPAEVAKIFRQGMVSPSDAYPFIVDIRAGLHLGHMEAIRD